MSAKKGLFDLHEMKRAGEKIAWLTAYDYPTARFEEAAGVDMILVGDSLGMCVYGYEGTVPVTMDQCIVHCEAVRRGAPNTFVVGDMPFVSYQVATRTRCANAEPLPQGGQRRRDQAGGRRPPVSRIRAILDAGIVVCGHIGLTPQSSGQLGGHKAQGRTPRPPGWWSRTRGPCRRPACSCCSSRRCPPRSPTSSGMSSRSRYSALAPAQRLTAS